MAKKKLTQAEEDLVYHCKNCGKLKANHQPGTLSCPLRTAEGEEIAYHPEFTYQLILQYRCKHCGKLQSEHKANTFNCPMKSTRRTFLHYLPDVVYEPTEKNPVKVKFQLFDHMV